MNVIVCLVRGSAWVFAALESSNRSALRCFQVVSKEDTGPAQNVFVHAEQCEVHTVVHEGICQLEAGLDINGVQ